MCRHQDARYMSPVQQEGVKRRKNGKNRISGRMFSDNFAANGSMTLGQHTTEFATARLNPRLHPYRHVRLRYRVVRGHGTSTLWIAEPNFYWLAKRSPVGSPRNSRIGCECQNREAASLLSIQPGRYGAMITSVAPSLILPGVEPREQPPDNLVLLCLYFCRSCSRWCRTVSDR